MATKTQSTNGKPSFSRMVANVLMERSLWVRRLIDPRRDIDFECGHPETILTQDYKKAFLRGDIATRVVNVWPEESWADRPAVFETEDPEITEFEKAWNALEKKLNIYPTLERADVLSGIGRYGIVLLGVDDGKPLNQPVEGIDNMGNKVGNTKHGLLYLRPLDESLLTISSTESDMSNPRFGLPTAYSVQFEDAVGGKVLAGGNVHWSRVIHIADNRTSSDVYGLPRMEKVFNRLLDVNKIAGGSGEMFWKGGFPGLSLEAQPGAEETLDFDVDATKEQLEAYMNGLQRYLATVGMTSKTLNVQVADPGPHLEVQVRLIAMALGVPWRVFMGSEAAQLASEQDSRSWNRRLNRRRDDYVTPYILRPLVERLVAFGTLPEPKEIIVSWPDLNTPSDKDKADVGSKRTDALAKYVQGGVSQLVPPFHYLTVVLGMRDEEAHSIIEHMGEDVLKVDGMDSPTRQGMEGSTGQNA